MSSQLDAAGGGHSTTNDMTNDTTNDTKCVEHGVWTPAPAPAPAGSLTLALRDVAPQEWDRVTRAGRMTFHAVGCTGAFGDHQPQVMVAKAMAAQVEPPGADGHPGAQAMPASFLFHLGDIVYKPGATSDVSSEADEIGTAHPTAGATLGATLGAGQGAGSEVDQATLYNDQFYAPYTDYSRRIFAIAGNHDGKYSPHRHKSAIDHFLDNFCASGMAPSADNTTDQRLAMPQPYVYWRLSTPLAEILGLYANIANGGILDDPGGGESAPQYSWLVSQLTDIRQKNQSASGHKAIVLAVHYPPFSGTANFARRGDPTLGPTNAIRARPLATRLQQAFAESGQRPDLVLSAHVHLYQRVTYHYADGYELPYLIVGSGGHGPVEKLGERCDKLAIEPPASLPFDCVLPPGLTIPQGESAQVVAYNEQSFGFLRVSIGPETLAGEFFAVDADGQSSLADSFTVGL